MKQATPSTTFGFLNDNLAKEQSINDILTEILICQKDFFHNRIDTLATIGHLQTSRNIKIPISPNRDKNIQYLVEQLMANFPKFVIPIFSINFEANTTTKQIKALEKTELTVELANEKLAFMRDKREQESINNFLNFIAQFGIINLTKIINATQNQPFLIKILNTVNDKTMFAFKQFSYDKSNLEKADDYCFHVNNFNKVTEKLQTKAISDILTNYHQIINTHIKKFGIGGLSFSGYKDNKLEYILSVLLNDIFSSLHITEKIAVKNFYSLREILIKAEKIINPLIELDNEIASNIRKLEVCSQDVLLTIIPNLTKKLLNDWSNKYATEQKIVVVPDADGASQYICANAFFKKYSESVKLITKETSKFDRMSKNEKEQKLDQTDFFTAALSDLMDSGKITQIYSASQQTELKSLYDAYEAYNQTQAEKMASEFRTERESSGNIFMRIIEAILNFFRPRNKMKKGRHGDSVDSDSGPGISNRKSKSKRPPTKHTMQLIEMIDKKSAPLIALSDIIDFVPENDDAVSNIIDTLDALHKKIVIPIYDSDKNLYPKRSLEVLMPNIEYLLIDPSHIATTEAIQDFINSIRGYRLKGEVIPVNAVFAIEKYLMGISRKKRTLRRV